MSCEKPSVDSKMYPGYFKVWDLIGRAEGIRDRQACIKRSMKQTSMGAHIPHRFTSNFVYSSAQMSCCLPIHAGIFAVSIITYSQYWSVHFQYLSVAWSLTRNPPSVLQVITSCIQILLDEIACSLRSLLEGDFTSSAAIA